MEKDKLTASILKKLDDIGDQLGKNNYNDNLLMFIDEQLEKALSNIRTEFREIIVLHQVEDLTFQEISEITKKPLNTVKSQYRRGLIALRKELL